MNRRAVWVLLVLLAVAVGLTWWASRSSAQADIEPTPTVQSSVAPLFSEGDGTLTRIRITGGGAVEVARDTDGVWQMIAPAPGPADTGRVESAATQIMSLRVLNRLEIAPELVGLDTPAYTLQVTFTSGREETVRIGDLTPTGSGYYARLSDGSMLILSRSSVTPLFELLTTPPAAP